MESGELYIATTSFPMSSWTRRPTMDFSCHEAWSAMPTFPGKYTEAQMMRFRREGARQFLRYPVDRFPGSLIMGDCGAFTYRNMREPPYRVEDTVEFYADGGFTHGFSPDHLIFDFDDVDAERSSLDVPEDIRRRYDITLQNAAEFLMAAKRLGQRFYSRGGDSGLVGL